MTTINGEDWIIKFSAHVDGENAGKMEYNSVWGSDCTHCMACICDCPAEAIEYGKKSVGKPRYTFEKTCR